MYILTMCFVCCSVVAFWFHVKFEQNKEPVMVYYIFYNLYIIISISYWLRIPIIRPLEKKTVSIDQKTKNPSLI